MSFWLPFLSPRTEFTIDGRKIKIIGREKYNRPLIAQIKEFCRKDPSAQLFPELTFLIEQVKRKEFAWINPSEIKVGIMIIHLNLKMVGLDQKKREEVLVHELTHLWHDSIAQQIQKSHTAAENLLAILAKKEIPDTTQKIRVLLFNFVRLIQEEGIAVFSEKYYNREIFFSERELQRLYSEARKSAVNIHEVLADYKTAQISNDAELRALTVQFIQKFIHDGKYILGLHTVYSIRAIEHITLRIVAELKPFEFIKRYEECMISKGLTPVISVTSGKGVLDYKKMLSDLNKVIPKR
ncbi:hypothetical protein HYT55_02260 [Candidatus Woesearchaeota archaeon]|nr:hypothetical protein [Candidatus Woesearchaeota archaeon]